MRRRRLVLAALAAALLAWGGGATSLALKRLAGLIGEDLRRGGLRVLGPGGFQADRRPFRG